MGRGRVRVGVVALVVALVVPFAAHAAPAAVGLVGAGGSDSVIAIRQWESDAALQGILVNYFEVVEPTGHRYYLQGLTDFSVSDLPFTSAEQSQAAARPYRYVPLFGSGTAFMYHLDIDGTRVTNLRLTPTTLALIFTGRITNWDDPRIAADNRNRSFPDLPLTPVIRSDSAGSSLRIAEFFAQRTPKIWQRFCVRLALATCDPGALYPPFPGSASENGSDGSASIVAGPSANGAIAYVPDGSARADGFPVVSVLNAAGHYVQPNGPNVSAALKDATTLADGYPVLSGVYGSTRQAAYPISSYSFMIVPTSTAPPFSTDKGDQLARFLVSGLCQEQEHDTELGYAPLPTHLVRVGLKAIAAIPGAPEVPHTC